MKRLIPLLVFASVNVIGFFIAPGLYVVGVALGRFSNQSGAEHAQQMHSFFSEVTLTWAICALFSITSFFQNGMARIMFLLAPIAIPLAYGLRVIFLP